MKIILTILTLSSFAIAAERPPNIVLILLDEQAANRRDAVFGVTHSIHNMTPGDPDDTLQYLWCVEDEWKLIVRHHGRDTTRYRNVHLWDKAPVRLYRIKDDPQEKHDLAARHSEVVERLRGKMKAWHPVNGN